MRTKATFATRLPRRTTRERDRRLLLSDMTQKADSPFVSGEIKDMLLVGAKREVRPLLCMRVV